MNQCLLMLSGVVLAGGGGESGSAMDALVSGADRPTQTGDQFFHSFLEFTHGWFVLSLLCGLSLAVGCSWLLAMHPLRGSRSDPVGDLLDRRTLMLVGLIGAVATELVRVEPVMAFVMFGIGGLIRFRTVMQSPGITAKAIICVAIGLASGLGQYATAVFVTAFTWGLLYLMGMRVGVRFRVRVAAESALNEAVAIAAEVLRQHRCRIIRTEVDSAKRRVDFHTLIPQHDRPADVARVVRSRMPRSAGDTEVTVETA